MGRLAILVLVAGLAACARHYRATGVVVAVDPSQREATISHDPIPGFMDAMVMPFVVAPGLGLERLAPGDRVAFRLRVSRHASRIDRLEVLSAARVDAGLMRSPAVATLTPVGAQVSPVTLTDHRGLPQRLDGFAPRVTVVTFLYTRCPLPDYCPRLMAHMQAVARRFADRLATDVVLAVVTFDPQYDTVDVLRAYAAHYDADVAGWHFLTGTTAEIGQVAEAFGVEYWPDEGLLSHTLMTAVIGRDARLAAVFEGRQFTARQLGDVVARALASPAPAPRVP